MSKASKKTNVTESNKKDLSAPWIQMQTGIVVMAITSVALAVWIAVQVSPARGWLEAIGWGVFFAAFLWLIFLGNFYFNRWLRRKQ